jgi:hypothetical protein
LTRQILRSNKESMTSGKQHFPTGSARYFLSGHRRLSEEHLPIRDATPPETKYFGVVAVGC